LSKVDEAFNPLSGAKFTLTETNPDNHEACVFEATSDSDGKVTFTGVHDGEYTLAETEAPSGYLLSNSTYAATVEIEYNTFADNYDTITTFTNEADGNESFDLELVNEQIKPVVASTDTKTAGASTPTTGDNTVIWLWMVLLGVSVLSIAGIALARKRKLFRNEK
jgi:uncharacterized surface anchored protein